MAFDGKVNEMRNVGTTQQPTSWLHERAIAILWDELNGRGANVGGSAGNHAFEQWIHLKEAYELDPRPERASDRWVRARLTPKGPYSGNLLAGVSSVSLPSEWDSIGGIVPDLVCWDSDRCPVRIIEVIVTSPPDKRKQEKLERLKDRNVDVVEIKVQSEKDLRDLIWTPTIEYMGWNGDREGRCGPFDRSTAESNDYLTMLMRHIRMASPQVRREFLLMFKELSSLDSLHPVSNKNPLRKKLRD